MLSYIPGMSCILTTIFVNSRGFEFSTRHPLQKQQLMKVSSVLVSLDKASEQKRWNVRITVCLRCSEVKFSEA